MADQYVELPPHWAIKIDELSPMEPTEDYYGLFEWYSSAQAEKEHVTQTMDGAQVCAPLSKDESSRGGRWMRVPRADQQERLDETLRLYARLKRFACGSALATETARPSTPAQEDAADGAATDAEEKMEPTETATTTMTAEAVGAASTAKKQKTKA